MQYLTVPVSYPQRHHPRLAGYDYRTPGYYFVTLCTQDRLPLFGAIQAGEMHRSEAGEMVHTAWRDLVDHHSGIAVDTLITMQDHVHALVVLEDDPRRTLSLSDVIHRYKSRTAIGLREGLQRTRSMR